MRVAVARCGTPSGYARHFRLNQPRCAACSEAHKLDRIERQRRIALVGALTYPAIATTRRLQALAVAGFSALAIAEEMGTERSYIRDLWRGERTRVFTRTHVSVERLYVEWGGRDGDSTITAARAKSAGWAPWWAWDDDTIGDPDARPNLTGFDEAAVRALLRGEEIESDRLDRREAARRLVESGLSRADAAAVLKVTEVTVGVYVREAA